MSRAAIFVSVLAVAVALVACAFSFHLLVSDVIANVATDTLAVSQAKGISSAATGGANAIAAGAVAHDLITTIDREFSFVEWNLTFHGRSRFTRAGDMRYLQFIIDQKAWNSTTPRYWLSFLTAPLGLTTDDLPRTTAFSTRQWCHALINGDWYQCAVRIHAEGAIYIRTLEAGIDGVDWTVWVVSDFDEVLNSTVSIPSAFLAWPVANPSPHGLHIERTPEDPVVPLQ